MNTNEIPIKLLFSERYTRGDDRFHVIHEDDINDDSKEERRISPLIVLSLSFFLSFARTNFVDRRKGLRLRRGSKNSDEKRKTSAQDALSPSRVCLSSLLRLFRSRQNGKASILSLVSRECCTTPASFLTRFFLIVLTTRVYSNTYILNTTF